MGLCGTDVGEGCWALSLVEIGSLLGVCVCVQCMLPVGSDIVARHMRCNEITNMLAEEDTHTYMHAQCCFSSS